MDGKKIVKNVIKGGALLVGGCATWMFGVVSHALLQDKRVKEEEHTAIGKAAQKYSDFVADNITDIVTEFIDCFEK